MRNKKMVYNYFMAYRVSRGHFERLAEQAVDELPGKFKRYFSNITIIVEDYPTREDARLTDVPRSDLLGLFRGIAYPAKGGFFDIPAPLPDEIILFRKNLERFCSSEEELLEEIRTTLIHEVGHYFGFSEEELAEYE